MIDAVGLVRGLNVAAGSTIAGMLVLVLIGTFHRTQQVSSRIDAMTLRQCVLGLGALFLASGAMSMWLQAAAAAGTVVDTLSATDAWDFARSTWIGQVWLARIALIAGVLLVLLPWQRRAHITPRLVLSLAALAALSAQGALALASHAVSADDAGTALGVQIIHCIAASVWFGGLVATTMLVLRAPAPEDAARALARFSNIALAAMLVLIASGLASAIEQLDRWPPLFGTAYGHRLLGKMVFLVVVLACAALLRFVWLRRAGRQATSRRALHTALVIEGCFGLLVMLLASQLATTTPGRHDAIEWPFGFRVDAERLWPDSRVQQQVWTALAIGAGMLAACLALRARVSRAALGIGVALSLTVTITIGVPPLTVEAYPDTYRQSSVAYDATSIAAGRRLYSAHCTNCHGVDATGNGPLAQTLAKSPADLTAPHAGEHTPGDLYWWLTHGMRGQRMPGFAGQLSSDERWDMINYLHTLSRGYQARIIQSRAIAGRPWLAAPLFNYTTRENAAGTLREFREHSAVLLVLFSWPQSAPRIDALVAWTRAINTAGASVLAVPLHRPAPEELAQIPAALSVVTDGSEEIATSYALFRRTLDNARTGESGPLPSHMEFLIDRFGYLRARWLPEDSPAGWSNEAALLDQLRLLQAEQRIKPPPDDHLH